MMCGGDSSYDEGSESARDLSALDAGVASGLPDIPPAMVANTIMVGIHLDWRRP